MRTLFAAAVMCLTCGMALAAEPVKVIFDTDMLTDFDDVGALASLHALADAGECEILATVSCTRGNASVAAIEVINGYYGRPDLPVGVPKGMGVSGGGPYCDKNTPLAEGGHGKYVKLAKDYPQWVKHANSDEAPDANDVYRKALAASPDGSVVICSVGFLTNLRRLLETKGDAISPLDGRALVAKKVKKWVAMACNYPNGMEYNSRWDWESSKIALENWPTPVVFSDFQYGWDVYAGRAVAETDGPRNPVKDVFAGNIPSRPVVAADPARYLRDAFGMGGRSAWDETAVLAAVRGTDLYFNVHRGHYRMVGTDGADEWVPDEEKGPHVRITEKMNKVEVGRIIDELICRGPRRLSAASLTNRPSITLTENDLKLTGETARLARVGKPIATTVASPRRKDSAQHGQIVKAFAAAPEHPVVLFGDSLTANWRGKRFAPMKEEFSAVNAGICGDRISDLLWRIEDLLPALKAKPPRVATFLIGTNDISMNANAEEIAAGMRHLVEVLRAACPETKIAVFAIPPRGVPHDLRPLPFVAPINRLYRDLADDKTVFFFDFSSLLTDRHGANVLSDMFEGDKLHFSDKGYAEVVTPYIAGAIRLVQSAHAPDYLRRLRLWRDYLELRRDTALGNNALEELWKNEWFLYEINLVLTKEFAALKDDSAHVPQMPEEYVRQGGEEGLPEALR